jgi:antitoxin (DNA-binding transcriptional repressor) of toxin-antitoxin stability system
MRRVGVREFKDHATTYLSGAETLVIERRGKPVGFFVPIEAKDRKAGRAALRRLDTRVADVLRTANISEEELVQELEAKPKAKRTPRR